MRDNTKQQLIDTFHVAVDAVAGYNATYQALLANESFQPDMIISVGKAASGMCAGAIAALEQQQLKIPTTLLITKYKHTDNSMLEHPQVRVLETAHPIPDENSLAAGKDMLDAVSNMPNDSQLLLLVSGGTSSLSEHLPTEVTLSQWQIMTDDMLSQGFNIGQINAKRKQTSLIKDGKLLQAFKGKQVKVLAISDVEGDDISVIGSGTGDTKHTNATASIELIGTNQVARNAAAKHSESLGYSVISNIENMYQDVVTLTPIIANQLIAAADANKKGVYIFGGEPTVNLPANPGNGGRNQSLALSLAVAINQRTNISILVAGTDGSDGPTDAAGGIVDGSSANHLAQANEALLKANAGDFLRETGDIFITGPTNTNVMDLVIAIID